MKQSQVWARLTQGGWALFEYLIYPLLLFATTPFFLSELGSQQYAQWMFVLTLAALGGLAGFGMNFSVIKDISIYRGKGRINDCIPVIEAALGVTFIGIALIALIILGISFGGAVSYFNGIGESSEVRILSLLSVILITLEQIDAIYSAVIRGIERYDLTAKIEFLTRCSSLVVAAFIANISKNVVNVIVVFGIFNFLKLYLKASAVKSSIGAIAVVPNFSLNLIRPLLNFGKWAWLLSLGGAIYSVADRAMISSLLDTNSLTEYSVSLQVAQQVQAIPAAALNWIYPATAFSIASNDRALPRKVIIYVLANVALTASLVLIIVMFSDKIVDLWLGGKVRPETSATLASLAIAIGVLSINIAPHYVLMGFNKPRYLAITNALAGGISLFVCVLLIPAYGLVGAASGRLFFGIAICYNYYYLHKTIRIWSKEL